MIENRSVPVNVLLPHITYRDVAEASAWLARVFGFREHYRYGVPASGMQMHLGAAWIMLDPECDRKASAARLGFGTQTLTLFVDDVEGHYAHAKSCGAAIVEEPHETVSGEFQYAAADLDGHLWIFSRHARDIAPQDWGAYAP
jgi:uncharacterized glyoxalase superfamily protein PhnB